MMRYLMMAITVVTAVLGVAGAARAQEAYPSRTVRIVVPFAPGASANDVVARAFAPGLQQRLGQPVIVENKAGATGIIGMEYVAKSAPDGYTIALFTSGFTTAPAMVKLPFSVEKDFAPIGIFATIPFAMFVHPSVPATNIQELIAHAKQNPGKLSYAIPGFGQPHHLAMELFMKMTGTKFFVVPYSKGITPAIPDLLSGQISVLCGSISSMLPYVQSGKVRVLGATGLQPAGLLKDVPPIANTVPGFEASIWAGFAAPAGTPSAIIARLNAEFARVIPDVVGRMTSAGIDLAPGTPAQMAATVRADIEKWGTLIREAGIKPTE